MAKNTAVNPDLNPDLLSDAQIDASDSYGIPSVKPTDASVDNSLIKPLAEKGSDMVTVCIPSRPDGDDVDFMCSINGKKYRIPVGEEVTVPKFVWEFYLSYCADIKRNNTSKRVMSNSAKNL